MTLQEYLTTSYDLPFIERFTQREQEQFDRLRAVGLDPDDLPECLRNWPMWVGDASRYLNDLRNTVDSRLKMQEKISRIRLTTLRDAVGSERGQRKEGGSHG